MINFSNVTNDVAIPNVFSKEFYQFEKIGTYHVIIVVIIIQCTKL